MKEVKASGMSISRSDLKQGVVVIYWFQTILATALMLGLVYRVEQPFSAIQACQDVYRREGTASSLLCGYLYAAFYSVFFAAPFAALRSTRLICDRLTRLFVAAWAGLTLLMFGEALFAFARALPAFIVLALWTFFTAFLLLVVWSVRKNEKEEANARKSPTLD